MGGVDGISVPAAGRLAAISPPTDVEADHLVQVSGDQSSAKDYGRWIQSIRYINEEGRLGVLATKGTVVHLRRQERRYRSAYRCAKAFRIVLVASELDALLEASFDEDNATAFGHIREIAITFESSRTIDVPW